MRRRDNRRMAALAAIAAAALLAACDITDANINCTSELGVHVTPVSDTTIAVGDDFPVTVQLTSCGGRQQLSDAYSLKADDTSVVTVSGMTVSAASAGTTRVWIDGERYGRFWQLEVTVAP